MDCPNQPKMLSIKDNSTILPPESEEDNIEYKRQLFYDMLDSTKIDSLITQMRWRVKEGNGNAIYYLGVNDDGTIYGLNRLELKETLNVFKVTAQKSDVEIISINTINHLDKIYYKIEIKEKCNIKSEMRILVIGHENSGKSTLVSALVHKQVDNGNGFLRNLLVSHKHELYSGKLNSITVKTIDLFDTNISHNITLIDTPGNIMENKMYLDKLVGISNYCFIVHDINSCETQINPYIQIATENNLPFCIVKTKGSNETNESNELNLLNKIPDDFISGKIDLFRPSSKYNVNGENQTLVLTKLFSGDCLYLLICVQISGSINLGDNIVFTSDINKSNKTSGTVESIQYMGCTHTSINKNITFTCFIKTDQIIKKLKGEIFYSI